jgi:hypothetical protein
MDIMCAQQNLQLVRSVHDIAVLLEAGGFSRSFRGDLRSLWQDIDNESIDTPASCTYTFANAAALQQQPMTLNRCGAGFDYIQHRLLVSRCPTHLAACIHPGCSSRPLLLALGWLLASHDAFNHWFAQGCALHHPLTLVASSKEVRDEMIHSEEVLKSINAGTQAHPSLTPFKSMSTGSPCLACATVRQAVAS